MGESDQRMSEFPELLAAGESPVKRQRLFFALWPDGACRQSLARLARERIGDNARLVKSDSLHMTLTFLGGVDGSQRKAAEDAAKKVTVAPFAIKLERIGQWAKSSVVWSAPQFVPEPLQVLVNELSRSLTADGFTLDSRPFNAHVTLARNVHEPLMETPHETILWQVGRFYLVQTINANDGVGYRPLKSWPLRVF